MGLANFMAECLPHKEIYCTLNRHFGRRLVSVEAHGTGSTSGEHKCLQFHHSLLVRIRMFLHSSHLRLRGGAK